MKKKWKNVNDFAVLVTKLEGKKRSMPIGQIKEVLKITNELLEGWLYATIKDNGYYTI